MFDHDGVHYSADIPNYYQIIQTPMDLGTVKQRMENEYYESLEQWITDINLVWSNAIVFNPPGNDVHECAKILQAMFEKRVRQLPKPPDANKGSNGSLLDWDVGSLTRGGGGGGGGGSSSEAEKRRMIEIQRKLEKMQSDLDKVKSGGAVTPAQKTSGGGGGSVPKKKPSSAPKKMTFDEKRALSLDISKLTEDKLGKVLEIIKKRRSNIVQNSEVNIWHDGGFASNVRRDDMYMSMCPCVCVLAYFNAQNAKLR